MALFSVSLSAILIAFSAIFVLMALWALKEDARVRLASFTVCAVLTLIGGKAVSIYASSAPSATELEEVYALSRDTSVGIEVEAMVRLNRGEITRTDVERWTLLANKERATKENSKATARLNNQLAEGAGSQTLKTDDY